MKYKDYDIDVEATNYSDGVAVIPLPDGLICCIPEEDATADEMEIIQQIKADIESRPAPEPSPVAEPGPTIEDYLVDLDYRMSMVELGL